MKLSRFAVFFVGATLLLTAGCASHQYYAAAPPPPPAHNGISPLIARAQNEGFLAGSNDGARDAYDRSGYHPRHDRKFHDAPGYDPALGPFGPYRDMFRNAYLRGYDRGFYNR